MAEYERLATAVPITVRSRSMPLRTPAPEVEVVAWMDIDHDWDVISAHHKTKWATGAYGSKNLERYSRPLYASPVVPVGVSEDQRQTVAEIVEAAIERHAPTKGICHTLDDADAILAALGTTDQGSRSKASVPTEVGQAAVLTAEQIEEDRLRDEDEALMPGGFN
jgi:hypothetical protein